jgi:hypothetical protein
LFTKELDLIRVQNDLLSLKNMLMTKNYQILFIIMGLSVQTWAKTPANPIAADSIKSSKRSQEIIVNEQTWKFRNESPFLTLKRGERLLSTPQNIKRRSSIDAGPLKDSVVVQVHPSYNKGGSLHRWFFGKNYRREWAIPVKLPLIRISDIYGGLIPTEEGGGLQTKSLRLKDKSGREYQLRSVEKTPDKILPSNLQNTFAVDWINDALSGQHPFSALVVPPLAKAAGVPHTNPIIGVVSGDDLLGKYKKDFDGVVCLLEEREPLGESDNTVKALGNVQADHDDHFDGEAFLRARILDVLIGDWDRHEDQWRWAEKKTKDGKIYTAVPRDRDQVFHVEEGLLPDIAALPYISPLLGDFRADIKQPKYWLAKTKFVNPYPDAQISHERWMQITNELVAAETDEIFETALHRLPKEVYGMRHDELLAKLKARRAALPAAMDKYYRFAYRIVDIRSPDNDEQITITDAPNGGLKVLIQKIKKGEVKDSILSMIYTADITKEIRLYTSAGDDRVIINNTRSPIDVRVVGGKGDKQYEIIQSRTKVKVYDNPDAKFSGQTDRLSKHLSKDTLNTQFVQTNPYNLWMPLAAAAINADDGFLLGLGVKYIKRDGFRKLPYTSSQQFMLTHSFGTDAFRIRYRGEWIDAIGKADLLMQAYIQAPDNVLNFFGSGNETVLNKNQPNYRRFYRTRYNTFEINPALRWNTGATSTITAGPSFQYYHLNLADNSGRFINNSSLIGSYDSLTVDRDKAHLGFEVNFNSNQRNKGILPTEGYFLNINLQGYTGLNNYSKSFMQLRPEFTFYQKLNSSGSVVLSDRIGGGVTLGKPAFYQSMLLGGQGNLLGYLQNRFAGRHMLFNNLQARVKLFNIGSYILPGQLGISGFYDTGRVWVYDDRSDKWHHGTGGGLYFAPAELTIIQVLAGHSQEGWYPYLSLNFRI